MRRSLIATLIAVATAGFWTSPASAATAWMVEPVPLPAGAVSGTLTAVSCSSGTQCVALGYFTSTSDGLAEQWNGTKWAMIPYGTAPAGAASFALLGIACGSAAGCTAVGYYINNSGTTLPLAEVWDGSTWTVQATPSPSGVQSALVVVACPAANDCTAVGGVEESGSQQQALAEHWDGSAWTIEASFALPPYGQLFGLSCTSATSCTAVGTDRNNPSQHAQTLAEHWDGHAWATQTTPSPSSTENILESVSCVSATSCTAVGYDEPGSITTPLAEHWDGHTWARQAIPGYAHGANGSSFLFGLSCTSASACTAVGEGFNKGATRTAMAEQWNGHRWILQRTASPVGDKSLSAISCTAAATCTAVGATHNRSGGPHPPLAEQE